MSDRIEDLIEFREHGDGHISIHPKPQPQVDWQRIREGCPRCAGRLQYHSLTAWCLSCGWAKNW